MLHKHSKLFQWCINPVRQLYRALYFLNCKRALLTNPTVILVYQMGRVGSLAVQRALRGKTAVPVLHLHTLQPPVIAAMAAGTKQVGHPLPRHLQISRLVVETLASARDQKQWRVISLVRDPVARNVSAFFNQLPLAAYSQSSPADADLMRRLHEQFVMGFDHELPLRWMEEELKKSLGINVYETPFPHTEGWQVLQRDNLHLLLLRNEDLARSGAEALQTFLDIRAPITVRNIPSNQPSEAHFQAFQRIVRLPESLLNTLYESRYAQHFYTAEEREGFKARWR